jgi:hypothetical protein
MEARKVLTIALFPWLEMICTPAGSATITTAYVPGLNCDQVGKLAEAAATDIKGDPSKGLAAVTLNEKILEMQYLFRDSPQTEAAMEKLVRAIYGDPMMRAASPADVGKAYERTCKAFE